MSDAMNQWLESRGLLEQVIGCAVVYPDSASSVRSSSEELPEEVLQQLFAGFAEIVGLIAGQAIAASKLRWVFEDCLCHAVPRADGICLMLLTTKDFAEGEALQQLSAEFRAL
jgi:hypothetical protein